MFFKCLKIRRQNNHFNLCLRWTFNNCFILLKNQYRPKLWTSSTWYLSHLSKPLHLFYIPMWLLNGSDSCNDNGFDDEMKFWSGARVLNLSISLLLLLMFIECSEFMACGQPIVGSRGTGLKTCCHLSGVKQSFGNASLSFF